MKLKRVISFVTLCAAVVCFGGVLFTISAPMSAPSPSLAQFLDSARDFDASQDVETTLSTQDADIDSIFAPPTDEKFFEPKYISFPEYLAKYGIAEIILGFTESNRINKNFHGMMEPLDLEESARYDLCLLNAVTLFDELSNGNYLEVELAGVSDLPPFNRNLYTVDSDPAFISPLAHAILCLYRTEKAKLDQTIVNLPNSSEMTADEWCVFAAVTLFDELARGVHCGMEVIGVPDVPPDNSSFPIALNHPGFASFRANSTDFQHSTKPPYLSDDIDANTMSSTRGGTYNGYDINMPYYPYTLYYNTLPGFPIPTEPTAGAYYYKYSYSWGVSASQMDAVFDNTTVKFVKYSNNAYNNAYVFITALSNTSGLDFGFIADARDIAKSGFQKLYSKNSKIA